LWLAAGVETLRGRISEATEAFEQSIQYARQTKNLHHEALACELYSRFWRQRGNLEVAALYLKKAQQRFVEWGALAKAGHLEGVLSNLALDRSSAGDSTPAVQPQTPFGDPLTAQVAAASLDLATVTRAARAIAVEIDLDELLRKLMSIALQNAGAQRGLFLQETNGQLVIAAEADGETIHLFPPVPLEGSKALSHTIVRYVQQSRQSVVVDDAGSDPRFPGDPYISVVKPKSILCVPVIHQGRFGGILYLENNLAANAFTSERIEVMRILSSQAAISLENARLYEEMKKEAAQRQDAEAMLRSITEGTASVTGTDFFRSLVRYLATALRVRYAFVTACHHGERMRAEMLAFWTGESFGDNCSYDVEPTPCNKVLEGNICQYGENLQSLFPEDRDLVALGAQSFLGVPMFNASGVVIGHIAILDDKPMADDAQRISVLRIFAARGAAELERLRAEESLRTALGEVENLKNRLHAENIYLQEEIRREHNFEEIVGSSPALVALLRQVEQVAPTDSTVLIYGETGTGKELIARAIHDRSVR
jgi:transcriptional regulator with GAF, ATPase, and Fis domain